MSSASRKDPYLAFRFQVAIDALPLGGFSEVSGIALGCEMESYQEGGLNDRAHQRPKQIQQGKLTLKRGLVDRKFYAWFTATSQGVITAPRNLSLFGRDPSGSKIEWAYQFFKVYPARWIGPDLKADSSAVAVETIELSYGGFAWLN